MAKLTVCTIDIESFWSPTHSLTKMSPIAYCMHPDTELISCAFKFNNDKTHVVFGEEAITNWFASVDWSDKIVIAHNGAGFDFMILAWRLGVVPAMWADTLCMARPIHAKTTGLSLAALVKHYGLGTKDQAALINTKGRHLKDFTMAEREAMKVYNKTDVDQCWGLFKKLYPLTSKEEMRLIDMTTRMLVAPKFVVDRNLLVATLNEERVRKQKMLVDLGKMIGVCGENEETDAESIAEAVCKTLGSAPKFSALLTELGVEVPRKISPTTGKEAPALAKTDEAFIALQDHDNPIVAAAARARLGVKSTLLETRIEAFIEASDSLGGKLPVPIKYYGADTTGRDSGWAYNCQNLPRVSGKPSDALRNSLTAGPGKKVVVADLSGIELRVNMFLWKVPYAMELFRKDPEKADLYKALASEVLDVPIDGMPKMVRQAGKAMHLGCGFGLGTASKYRAVAKTMAGVIVSEDEASQHINGYRRKHPEIVQGWKTCHAALKKIYMGVEEPIDPWGLCWTCQEGIRTPKGIIRYPDLREETTEDGRTEWMYGSGRNKARIYAGKVDENIVQSLARNVVMGMALDIEKQFGLSPTLRVHDELVYVVDEDDAEQTLANVQSVMRTPPAWWSELVVWSEGDIADTYGAAK